MVSLSRTEKILDLGGRGKSGVKKIVTDYFFHELFFHDKNLGLIEKKIRALESYF